MEKWDSQTVENNLAKLQYPSVGDDCGFSCLPCWTCKRPLGGDRVQLKYVHKGEIYHEEICIDCAMYIANGEEPMEENIA